MLEITVQAHEHFDSESNAFIALPPTKLRLEHSLLSISKWETKWKKPFLSKEGLTKSEYEDYVKCMTIGEKADDLVYSSLSNDNMAEIKAYMEDPMTATTFKKTNERASNKIVTSEVLYYRMFVNKIPITCEKWHLNRLLTLIRVFDIENGPAKKQRKGEALSRTAQLNNARLAKYNTKG